MVRFRSAVRAPACPTGVAPLGTRRNNLLRRLLDENLALKRELEELRLLRRMALKDAPTGLPDQRPFVRGGRLVLVK